MSAMIRELEKEIRRLKGLVQLLKKIQGKR